MTMRTFTQKGRVIPVLKIKKSALFAAVFFMLSVLCRIPASAVTFKPDFSLVSKAAVMINLDTGDIVFEKNSDKKMYPASLTKIVTALVVLDNVDDLENTYFEAPLAVYDDLFNTGALTIGISRGETVSVKDLMYSMLVYSACESAGILAYNVGGGSIPNFVSMMNDKVSEIGCVGTNFVNPHGLYDRAQYTNAADMAKITEYALENYPVFEEIACTTEYSMGATNYSEAGWASFVHSNKMTNPASEYYYEYARGIKTGTTDESGRNLVSIAEKNGMSYLLVTMGAPMYDDNGFNAWGNFEDQIKLYDWAFDTLSYQTLIPAGQEITELQVNLGADKDYVRLITCESSSMLWSSEIDVNKLKVTIDTSDYTEEDGSVTAPIEKDQKLGTYSLSLNGEKIVSVDLIAQESIALSRWDYNLHKTKEFFHSPWFAAAVVIAVLLIAGYIFILIAGERSRKKRRIKKVRKSRKF